jgi:hypothetical protein
MPSYTELISESIRTQKETTILLKQGRIDKEEADDRITNAMQVMLFARAALEHKKTKGGKREASVRSLRRI